ncbi:molybdenum cofactor biosynthesis protein MoeB [Actinomyces sp. 432]|uniref:molybdopterin-synthase adenylyltransferase MoeB n=1 Tax=Actinomyces sp. 432 TaxID=2057798 RepID=UPI001373CD2D|nr:molybdopterin-synthase adenylyltransferase MoeB [Actinomyces sp. 432]QHO90873.1 molybdenum cofactor biosynthesis protein MoeB [Actinomyces sp. 432]
MTPGAGDGFPSLIDDARLRPLTAAERMRYSRNALVPEVGGRGQQRIRAARILVVGAGALGSPAVLYLAAAGVGTLGIIDDDVVAVSNLQRQVLHTTAAAGRPKVDSAREAVAALNPDVEIVTRREALTSANAMELLRGWDVVIDGTDNFPTRYLLGDACVLLGIPLVHGAVLRFDGQVTVFDAERGPCYRCVHPTPPDPGAVPSCAEAGVLGVLPGIVGAMQAAEALKLVVGGAQPLIGRMLLVNAWEGRGTELPIGKNPDCPVCGSQPTITRLVDYEALCGSRSRQEQDTEVQESTMNTITATELRERIAAGELPGQEYTLLDVREPHEVELETIEGAAHIPLAQVVERRGELDPSRELIVYCAGGVRSARAIAALEDAGYDGPMTNLEGGIKAWNASA